MTKEEAILILEEVKMFDDSMYQYNQSYMDALNMAIESLRADTTHMTGQSELIRCKDCEYFQPFESNIEGECIYTMVIKNANGFCNFADRKEE